MRDRFLAWLAEAILAHPKRVLLGAALIVAAGAALVPGLQVKAGHASMFAADDPHQRRFFELQRRFGSPNVLFVLVDGGSRTLRHAVIDELTGRLTPPGAARAKGGCHADGPPRQAGCVRDVVGRVDLRAQGKHALLHAPLAQVKQLVAALADEDTGLAKLLAVADLGGLFELAASVVEASIERAPPTGPEAARQTRRALSTFARLLDELRLRLTDERRSRAPLSLDAFAPAGALRGGVDAAGYFSSRDGKLALAMVRPVDESDEPEVVVPYVGHVRRQAAAAIERVLARCAATTDDEHRSGTDQGHGASTGAGTSECATPDGPLRQRLTGLPALIAEERAVLARDLPLTSAVAAVGILLLFAFAFRSLRQGLLGMLPLLAALVCTLAFVRLAVGGLNLVTSACIPTMLGLGIDFFVHLLARYNEGRWGGAERRAAMRAAINGAGPGILTGALTTSGAFLALAINRFKGFSDLGVITAVGLVFCLGCLVVTAAVMVLPGRLGRFFAEPPRHRARRSAAGVGALVVRWRKALLVLGLAISAVMLWRAPSIPWSYNYLELLPADREPVVAMLELARRSDFSGEIAVAEVGSIAEARELTAKLRRQPTIGRVESIVGYLPTGQPAKLAALAPLAELLERPPAWRRSTSTDLARLAQGIESLTDALQDARFEAKRGNHPAAALLRLPAEAAARLKRALAREAQRDPSRARIRASRLQGVILSALDQAYELLRANVGSKVIGVEQLLASLPAGIGDRLAAGDASARRFALYVYPRESVWEGDFLPRFVDDVRSLSPSATGFTVTHWEANVIIKKGFRDASVLAVAVLVLLLLVDFKRPLLAALALVPLAMGVCWMLGAMALGGMSYNFANIIAFPLIVGIGVASGVHILHRYRQQGQTDVAGVVNHTGLAILLSAATTMVGFGSLALAQHHGAAALGWLLLLGVGACLVTSTLVLPALLEATARRNASPTNKKNS